MTPQRQQQWRAILALTQQLLDLAEAGEWEELASRYTHRDAVLHDFFAQLDVEQEAAFLADAIPALQAMDGQLQQRCRTARDEVAQALGKLNRGRKAEAAYHQFR